MNWGVLGLAVAAALFVVVFVIARRGWNPLALVVSFGNWLVGAFNAAAPFRGALDPDYAGFTFGLVSAGPGLGVTAVAGALLVGATLTAAFAARQMRGPVMGFVAAFDGALLVILGAPLLQSVVASPEDFVIQFGEYLTIPALLSIPILLFLVLAPLALGTIWGASRLRR